MTADPDPVQCRTEGPVGIIELARPLAGNCLSSRAHRLILGGLRGFEADPAVRAVLLQAQGRNFCTGADLAEVQQVRQDEAGLRRFLEDGLATLAALEASDLPVIAAVQGLCLAGGLELVLACDVAFAAHSARFGDQHGQFGLVPGWGGTRRLPEVVGRQRALDLMFSARWLGAEAAASWGLVAHVVADDRLHDHALAFCTEISGRSAGGLAAMKRLTRLEGERGAGFRRETDLAVALLRSDDVAEGIAAFQERRVPAFGRRAPP